MQLLRVSGGANASCPDSANLSISDNLDLRIRCALDDWQGVLQTFISKRTGSGDEWQFRTHFDAPGRLSLVWWTTGGSPNTEVADADLGFEPGTMHWVRVRRSGTSVTFYWSDTDTNDHTAVSWTQLGSVQTTPSGSIRSDISTHVSIGARSASAAAEPMYGFITAAAVVDNTTTRADPKFYDPAEWTVGEDAGDTASDGVNTWTLFGNGEIIGDNVGPELTDLYVSVECAFASNPFDASLVWEDITSDVETLMFNRGRQFELDRVDTGTATLQLDNWHGNYNANNTTSPYYPNIKPMVPIRIRAVYDGTIYPLWQGFVERWPYSFPDNVEAKVTIQCADLFKLFALADASQPDRASAVNALSPVAYWRFADSSDEVGGHDLTYAGSPTQGGAVGVWTNDVATTFDGSDDEATVANESDVERQTLDRSYEFWFRPTSTTASTYVFSILAGAAYLIGVLHVEDPGLLSVLGGGGTFGSVVQINTPISVDDWHHVVVSDDLVGSNFNRVVYLDGAEIGSATIQDVTGSATVRIGALTSGVSNFIGDISEIAVYPTALTSAQVTTLYNAQFEAWETQRTDQRIEYILTQPEIGIGAEWLNYDLEEGRSIISGPNTPIELSVLEAMHVANDTEQGLLFMTGAGVVRFQDRHYRTLEQATPIAILDQTDYLTVYPEVADELIANDVRVAASDDLEPARVTDEDSVAEFGRRTLERTIYPEDPNEAVDAAYWLLLQYADAPTRVATLPFELLPTVPIATILGGELSNRYTLNVPLNGDDLSMDVFLEGISHSIDLAGRWTVQWQLSPAPAEEHSFWLLGVAGFSELGVTTVLGY